MCIRDSRNGALGQSGVLKDAHGAVPDNGLGSLGSLGENRLALFTDIQTHLVGGDGIGGHSLHGDFAVNGVGEGIGNHLSLIHI